MHNFPASMSAIHIQGHVTLLLEYSVADIRPLLHTPVFRRGQCPANCLRQCRWSALGPGHPPGPRCTFRRHHPACVFERLLLSLAGGLLGLVFAATAIRTALHLLPESMPRVDSISMDGSVVTFSLLLALATGALCSLAPGFAALART